MLEITGKLLEVSKIEQLLTKSGNTFEKRQIILDCSRIDDWTGDVYKNVLCFEIAPSKVHDYDNMESLVGQTIKVKFAINGRDIVNGMGEKKYFTTLRLIGIETSQSQHVVKNEQIQPNQQKIEQVHQERTSVPRPNFAFKQQEQNLQSDEFIPF